MSCSFTEHEQLHLLIRETKRSFLFTDNHPDTLDSTRSPERIFPRSHRLVRNACRSHRRCITSRWSSIVRRERPVKWLPRCSCCLLLRSDEKNHRRRCDITVVTLRVWDWWCSCATARERKPSTRHPIHRSLPNSRVERVERFDRCETLEQSTVVVWRE